MKRSRSDARLGSSAQVEREHRFDLLNDAALKRAKQEVEEAIEKRERCLLIRGGNRRSIQSNHLFCIVVDLRYADERGSERLEHWVQDWFGNLDVSDPSLDDCCTPCAFIAPSERAVRKEMDRMMKVTEHTSVVLLRWNQVYPVDELEVRLTAKELENGENWSQNGLPSLLDVLGVISRRKEISTDEILYAGEFLEQFYG